VAGVAVSVRDPFADDVLGRLRRSNQDYQHTHGHYIVPLSERLLASRARVRELENALAEAISFAEEGWGYASPYYREKWGYEEGLAWLRAALAAGGRSPGETEG
jgi:hypothetical protein